MNFVVSLVKARTRSPWSFPDSYITKQSVFILMLNGTMRTVIFTLPVSIQVSCYEVVPIPVRRPAKRGIRAAFVM